MLQRIGGVEARSERNDSRIDSLKVLLAKSKEEIFGQADDQTLDEDELDKAEQRLQELFEEIEGEFGAPPSEPDEIEDAARNASHALEGKIDKLESSLDKLRDKNVAAMQRFIADARNQAFRDELSLDLEEGYNNSTFDSFDGVRKLIEEEDLAKNRERFEELLRVQVPEEVSGFSEALESHRDRIRKRVNELNEHLSRVTFDRKEETFIQLKFEDAGDDGVRRFKKLRRHALEGDLEADDEDERRRERYHRVEQFLGELEQDMNWTERVIGRGIGSSSERTSSTRTRKRSDKVTVVPRESRVARRTAWHPPSWLPPSLTSTVSTLEANRPKPFAWLLWTRCSARQMTSFRSICWISLRNFICSCSLFSLLMLRFT